MSAATPAPWIWTDTLWPDQSIRTREVLLRLRRDELKRTEREAYAAIGHKLVAAVNGDKPRIELFVPKWTLEVGQNYQVLVRR